MTLTPEDAATAAEAALISLARATASTELADSYAVLGSVSASLVSLRQILDQLATWHDIHADRAAGTGTDPRAGYRHAVMAAARLRQATNLAERTGAHVDAAWADNGHIVWQPGPDAEAPGRGVDADGRAEPRRLPPATAFGHPDDGHRHRPGARPDGPHQ